MVDYEKIEKGGKVKFVRGLDERIVPSPEACKNKLIKLLESVKGDKGSVIIDTYFQQIADRMKDPDPMIGEYNMELFWRLEAAWDKLLAKPVVEEDLFEEFGL